MSASIVCGLLINVLLLSIMGEVHCQSCVESGRWCPDHAACCGGCCKNRVCLDTYESCLVDDDLCLNHYCPPGLGCYIYQPDCEGCIATPYCRESRFDY